MSAMSVGCVECMVCAWERWEYERVCAVGMCAVWVRVCGFCVCGRDAILLACDVTCDKCAVCVRCGGVCGVQSSRQPSRRGGSEGTSVVSGRSDASADTEVRGMSAMSVACVWSAWCVHGVCMVCAWYMHGVCMGALGV